MTTVEDNKRATRVELKDLTMNERIVRRTGKIRKKNNRKNQNRIRKMT